MKKGDKHYMASGISSGIKWSINNSSPNWAADKDTSIAEITLENPTSSERYIQNITMQIGTINGTLWGTGGERTYNGGSTIAKLITGSKTYTASVTAPVGVVSKGTSKTDTGYTHNVGDNSYYNVTFQMGDPGLLIGPSGVKMTLKVYHDGDSTSHAISMRSQGNQAIYLNITDPQLNPPTSLGIEPSSTISFGETITLTASGGTPDSPYQYAYKYGEQGSYGVLEGNEFSTNGVQDWQETGGTYVSARTVKDSLIPSTFFDQRLTIRYTPRNMTDKGWSWAVRKSPGTDTAPLDGNSIISITDNLYINWKSFPISNHLGNFNYYTIRIMTESDDTIYITRSGKNDPKNDRVSTVVDGFNLSEHLDLIGKRLKIQLLCQCTDRTNKDGTDHIAEDNVTTEYNLIFNNPVQAQPEQPMIKYPSPDLVSTTTNFEPRLIFKISNIPLFKNNSNYRLESVSVGYRDFTVNISGDITTFQDVISGTVYPGGYQWDGSNDDYYITGYITYDESGNPIFDSTRSSNRFVSIKSTDNLEKEEYVVVCALPEPWLRNGGQYIGNNTRRQVYIKTTGNNNNISDSAYVTFTQNIYGKQQVGNTYNYRRAFDYVHSGTTLMSSYLISLQNYISDIIRGYKEYISADNSTLSEMIKEGIYTDSPESPWYSQNTPYTKMNWTGCYIYPDRVKTSSQDYLVLLGFRDILKLIYSNINQDGSKVLSQYATPLNNDPEINLDNIQITPNENTIDSITDISNSNYYIGNIFRNIVDYLRFML